MTTESTQDQTEIQDQTVARTESQIQAQTVDDAAIAGMVDSGATTHARTGSDGRLEFLDALRGIAALLVVVEHVCELQWPSFAQFTLERFRFGEFGVVVFFLCSGFIIPASLERRGSLRDFWIGRFFRLFPLYWACVIAILVLHFGPDNYRGLDPSYWTHWLKNTAVNLTMVQDFTGRPLMLGQSWTLAYEMAFYVSVSILFVAGLHRRSAAVSALAMVVSLAVGNELRTNALSTAGRNMWTLAIVACVVGAGVVVVLTRSASPVTRLVCAFLGAMIVLALFNRYEPTFQAPFFLGTMFAGTAIYRWTRGELSSRALALLGLFIGVSVIVAQERDWSPWLNSQPLTNGRLHLAEVLTYLGAYALFFAAVLFRERHFPRVLTYLGAISYSLYLVHPLVIYTSPTSLGTTGSVVWQLVGTVLVSALTYRFIEQPAIRLGRAVTRRLRTAQT